MAENIPDLLPPDAVPDNAAPAEAQQTSPQIAAATQPTVAMNTSIPDVIPAGVLSDEEKYGTSAEQLKAGAEGALRGAISAPLASELETQLLGVKPEDIQGREKINPVTSTLSEIGGLAGTAMLGTGLGGALTKVGAAAKAGAEGIGLGKIGSAAAAAAVENMAYQSQREVDKLILSKNVDPSEAAQTALADIGLAGAIGGVIGGAAGPLWKATFGRKTSGILGAIADKAGGIEGIAPESFDTLLDKTGIDMPPELRGLVAQDPKIQNMAREMIQSNVGSGPKLQESMEKFRNALNEYAVGALGKTPEDIAKLGEKNAYESGKDLAETLASEYEAQKTPLSEAFDTIRDKYGKEELIPTTTSEAGLKQPGTVDSLSERIAQRAIQENWTTSPSSDTMREVRRVMKELPGLKTLDQLKGYITEVGKNMQKDPANKGLYRAGGIIKSILKDGEAEVLTAKLGEKEGPEVAAAFQKARSDWSSLSNLKDALNDRLHLGKASTSDFDSVLRQKATTAGEKLLNRLTTQKDANLLSFLQENYPNTAAKLRDYQINNLLRTAADKAKNNHIIDSGRLLKDFEGMSPQMRSFIASDEAINKVKAAGQILEHFKDYNFNFSNTSRVLEPKLYDALGIGSMIMALATGHGVVATALAAAVGKSLGKEAMDATKLALLKWLGSNKPINPGAFRSMVEFANSTIKGENLTSKAVKNLVTGAREVIPQHLRPNDNDRQKLNRHIDSLEKDPNKVLDFTGEMGHYMPDHAMAMSTAAGNALQYLKQNKPQENPQNPLDTKLPINKTQQAQYNRLMDLANQPLMILQHIADGTVTSNDINATKMMYPGLYNRIANKMTDQMAEAKSKGQIIPYKTRMGMSLYLGQGLDSTLTPAGILMSQGTYKSPNNPNMGMQNTPKAPKHMNSLNKLPNMYQSPNQAAEMDKLKRAR